MPATGGAAVGGVLVDLSVVDGAVVLEGVVVAGTVVVDDVDAVVDDVVFVVGVSRAWGALVGVFGEVPQAATSSVNGRAMRAAEHLVPRRFVIFVELAFPE